MPPQLLALTDGPNLLLDKPILLIGRHQECDIQIPSRKISRRHCCIAHVADYLIVRDLGSTNGIRVNGTRVLEGQLRSGDELVIGNFKYKVQFNGEAAKGDRKHAIKAVRPRMPNLQIDHPALADDSSDIPLALEEANAPVLPSNKSNPPDSPPVAKPYSGDLIGDDIPLALFPESMSLEPISEEVPERKAKPKK